jgi:Na+/proline symporter
VLVNLFFVSLGALLYSYANLKGVAIPPKTDHLFPLLALQHLGTFAAIAFIVGLTAATFSSADSVLTTLTTSFCIDFLGTDKPGRFTEQQKAFARHVTHIGFAILLLLVIMVLYAFSSDAVINTIFVTAGYTYGPLLGLFAFGLFSRRRVRDAWVPLICCLAPLACWAISANSKSWFGGYEMGFELLILNGALTALGLFALRKSAQAV